MHFSNYFSFVTKPKILSNKVFERSFLCGKNIFLMNIHFYILQQSRQIRILSSLKILLTNITSYIQRGLQTNIYLQ